MSVMMKPDALPQNWPALLHYFMITLILSLIGWAQLARYRLWQAELAGSTDSAVMPRS